MFWGCPQEAWFLLKTKQISPEGTNSVFWASSLQGPIVGGCGSRPVLGWRGDGCGAGLGALLPWLRVEQPQSGSCSSFLVKPGVQQKRRLGLQTRSAGS